MEVAGVVGIVGSIAVIFSVTRDYFRIINNIARADQTAFVAIQARMIAEEKKLEMWMAYVEVQTWTDMESILSSEDLRRVKKLWARLFELIDEARRRIQRVDLEKSKVINRARWVIKGEFERLQEVLDAIEAINSVLSLVATPPPGYTPPRSQNQYQNMSNSPPAAYTQGSSSLGLGSEQMTTSAQPVRRRRIMAFLFHRAVNALEKIIGHEKSCQSMVTCLHTLQGWSGTFLVGDMSLDNLLEKTEGGILVNELAKRALMTTFVDVLLIEEALLVHMTKSANNHNLDQARLEVVSTFFEDEVIDIATNRSLSLPVHSAESLSTNIGSNPTVPLEGLDMTNVTMHQISPVSGEIPEEDFVAECVTLLEEALEDLYDMLPVIRTLRRGHVLDLLQNHVADKAREDAKPTVLQIQDVLNDFDDIWKNLELPQETVDGKITRMAKEERDTLAHFQRQLDNTKIQQNKQDEIQRILKAVKTSIETGPTLFSGAYQSQVVANTGEDIKDPEKKRVHLKQIAESLRKGNEDLSALARDVS